MDGSIVTGGLDRVVERVHWSEIAFMCNPAYLERGIFLVWLITLAAALIALRVLVETRLSRSPAARLSAALGALTGFLLVWTTHATELGDSLSLGAVWDLADDMLRGYSRGSAFGLWLLSWVGPALCSWLAAHLLFRPFQRLARNALR